MRSIRRCLPGMIARRRGRILNIASTAASMGRLGCGAYCASKADIPIRLTSGFLDSLG